MIKRKSVFGLLIFAVVAIGGISAQEKSANARNNWISGELGLIGVGGRYERMLGPNFSVGANVYYSSLFRELEDAGIDIVGRYYPWGKVFFTGVGLGYHRHWQADEMSDRCVGIGITPELGWKIDAAKPGGFFVSPGLKLPITIGTLLEGGAAIRFGIVVYCGLGYAF